MQYTIFDYKYYQLLKYFKINEFIHKLYYIIPVNINHFVIIIYNRFLQYVDTTVYFNNIHFLKD